MDITVDRSITPEGDLIFSIQVKNPSLVNFGIHERHIMSILNAANSSINDVPSTEPKLKEDIRSLVHMAKHKQFERVIEKLKFSIKNSLEAKFNPMCQEIYNWMYDAQDTPLKEWMSEFDPQRTQFYFDNDLRAKRALDRQESEHEIEIDDEDDDE